MDLIDFEDRVIFHRYETLDDLIEHFGRYSDDDNTVRIYYNGQFHNGDYKLKYEVDGLDGHMGFIKDNNGKIYITRFTW